MFSACALALGTHVCPRKYNNKTYSCSSTMATFPVVSSSLPCSCGQLSANFDRLCVKQDMLILNDVMFNECAIADSEFSKKKNAAAMSCDKSLSPHITWPLISCLRFNALTTLEELATLSFQFVLQNTLANNGCFVTELMKFLSIFLVKAGSLFNLLDETLLLEWFVVCVMK